MARRNGLGRGYSRSAIARKLVACILVLDRAVKGRVFAETLPASSRSHQRDAPFVGPAVDQDDVLFDDLPEGFHDNVDSITLAVGGHHTCALEYRPGVDFGGPVRCWGRDDWGQSAPSDEIFVQVRLRNVAWQRTVLLWFNSAFSRSEIKRGRSISIPCNVCLLRSTTQQCCAVFSSSFRNTCKISYACTRGDS